jgi:hypothetical protein
LSSTGNVATGKPAESGVGKMAEKAKNSVTAANDKHNAALGETTTPATTPATGTTGTTGKAGETPASPATRVSEDLKGLPKPVALAITKQKVLVLLFWNSRSAEDRAVHSALRGIDRWDGRVFVKAAPIENIARYGRIARGVDVQQSPTIVVVDRKLAATPLVGYVDRQTIDQAVVDALRNSGGLYTSAYLREVNQLCASAGRSGWSIPQPNTVTDVPAYARAQSANLAGFVTDLRKLKAPAKFRAFARANVTDFAALSTVYATMSRSVRGNPGTAVVARSLLTAAKAEAPIAKRIDGRMDKHHLLSCGSQG